MSSYWILLKSNFKLLIRNKGYLSLVILLPLISVFLLNIRIDDASQDYDKVYELSSDVMNITNFEVDSKMVIKVYDSANNAESNYFLDRLNESGMYRIYRFISTGMSEEQIKASATTTANRSSLQAILYIPEDFIVNSRIVIYPIGDDSRFSLLEQHLSQNINIIRSYIDEEGNIDVNALYQQVIHKQIIEVDMNDSTLSAEQQQQQSNITLSLTTLILCFIFTGVCIVSVINYEKDFQVMTRILMIPNTNQKYVLVKVTITLVTVILQSLITMIYFILFVDIDLGISVFQYIGLIFGLGIIFNLISVAIGMFISNTLTISYITFFIWAMTNMLGGIYFPGVALPKGWDKVSLLVPQKWMLMTSEALLNNNGSAVITYVIVVLAYIIFIVTLGFLGIKLNQQE